VPGTPAAQPLGGRDFPGPGPASRLYQAADGWVRLAAPDGTGAGDLRRAGLLPPEAAGEAGAGLAGADSAGPDLDEADLAGADLAGVGLAGAGLAGADLAGLVAAAVAVLPVAEVTRRAAAAGLPAVRARQGPELPADDQLIRRGLLAVTERDEAGVRRVVPGRWLEVPGLDRDAPGPAPAAAGEHGAAILAEVGLDQPSRA
jgi:hypothetical protein